MVHRLYPERPVTDATPTPAQAYRAALHAVLEAHEGAPEEVDGLIALVLCLERIVASLDAELGRLTETVRRLEGAR